MHYEQIVRHYDRLKLNHWSLYQYNTVFLSYWGFCKRFRKKLFEFSDDNNRRFYE